MARSRGSAAERLERLVLEILAYHKENLITDQRVNDIVLVAMEHSWDAIQAHKEVIRTVVEMILRDGIEAGEFEPVDPRETSRSDHALAGRASAIRCWSRSACRTSEDVEAEARATVRFLLRAITPRS